MPAIWQYSKLDDCAAAIDVSLRAVPCRAAPCLSIVKLGQSHISSVLKAACVNGARMATDNWQLSLWLWL